MSNKALLDAPADAGKSSQLTTGLKYLAVNDGKDHINIYSRGQTTLGTMLSHFYPAHFKHPYLGPFDCMEGLWYYVRSGVKDDALRSLVGIQAKRYAKEKELPLNRFREFPEVIMDANCQKIVQNQEIYDEFVKSTLPFDHYYLFYARGHSTPVQIRPKGFDWLIEGFEELRETLKNGSRPAPLDYRAIFDRVFTNRPI